MSSDWVMQWREWFLVLSNGFVLYFFSANFIFLSLLVISFVVIRRTIWAGPMIESVWQRIARLGSPISVIAPAHNESQVIVESTMSFLSLNYPLHEVIVVNDGSTDDTLAKLKDQFGLEVADSFYDGRLSKTKVRGVYRSRFYRHLLVVDKEQGGKADAINVGLGFAQYSLVCSVDCDSILDDDALVKVAIPFVEEPDVVIASGGTVRPMNGSKVEFGRVIETGVSLNPLVLIQTVEYLRAFLFGRIGWNQLNATLIISGAFGVFSKEEVFRVGGFSDETVSEDMELVLNLRQNILDHNEDKRIAFVPDPICWTQVPEDLMSLGRQRRRWQRGLAESLLKHKKMFFNPRHGLAGLIAYPYFFFVELLGPIIEYLAYGIALIGWAVGWVSVDLLILLALVDLVFGVLMSMGAVLIEEGAFHKYPRVKHLFLFLGAAALEPLGYRQWTSFWRLLGLWDYITKSRRSWGVIQRNSMST